MDITNKYKVGEYISVHFISEDKYIISNYHTGDVFEVNETTKDILNGIRENRTAMEITEQLKKSAINEDEIEMEDVSEIIKLFFQYEIIELV